MRRLFSFGISLLAANCLNCFAAQEASVYFMVPWWVHAASTQRYVVPLKLLPLHLRSSQRQSLNMGNVNQTALFRSGSSEVVPRIPGSTWLIEDVFLFHIAQQFVHVTGGTSLVGEDRQLGNFVRRLNDLRDIWYLCTSGGRHGNCLPSSLCSLYGGIPSGVGTACLFSACCISIRSF